MSAPNNQVEQSKTRTFAERKATINNESRMTLRSYSPALLFVAMLAISASAQDREAELVRAGDVAAPVEVEAATVTALTSSEPLRTLSTPSTNSPSVAENPLARRLAAKGAGDKKAAANSSAKANSPTQSLIHVGGSLAIVLSLFCGLAYLTKRGMPRNLAKLPGEVIEVLGKAPLSKGQEMQIVRVGGKLLVLCVTANGSETLTEITNADEVDRLCAICRREKPGSVTAVFNQVLNGIGREPARGFANEARTRRI